jgi:hypothetical protein
MGSLRSHDLTFRFKQFEFMLYVYARCLAVL